MDNPKITVIVTVHNAEGTLRECLDSACRQTLKEIEILCIDGGSSDQSPEVLAEYRRADGRIRIINDKNTSYGHKINLGVKEAKGEYISILESDDCMKSGMLERLYEVVEKFHPDFVDSDYEGIYYVNGRRCVLPVKKYGSRGCYGVLIHQSDRSTLLDLATGAIWTGLYRTAFLREKGIRMFESPGAAYQDTSFRFLTCMLADTAYHISEMLYCYRMDNANSSIRDQKKIFAIADEYGYLEGELDRRGAGKGIWEKYYRWKYGSYFWNTFRLDESVRDRFIQLYQEELKNDIANGYIRRGNQDWGEYKDTFLLLDDREMFESYIREFAQKGNLNVNSLGRIVSELQGSHVVVFGCGAKGKQALGILRHSGIQINCICDNSSEVWQTSCEGYRVLPVEEAAELYQENVFVIPDGKYFGEMKLQLCALGILEEYIYKFQI